MKILEKEASKKLREQYIETFIDVEGKMYKEGINKTYKMSDGICYIGYLWDCFKGYNIIAENKVFEFLEKKNEFMLFWDINSCDFIKIDNYWQYPKEAIIQLDNKELKKTISTFPEDIYIFDKTFLWTVVFTHEITQEGNRSCILWQ